MDIIACIKWGSKLDFMKNEVIKKLASGDIWTQLNQAQEEAAELIVAINHHRRVKNNETLRELQKEIADNVIMLNQLCMMFCKKEIDGHISEKLMRASGRIKDGSL
jgi:NTP pyrophosphatase (non-canonical NTP hydrolase)